MRRESVGELVVLSSAASRLCAPVPETPDCLFCTPPSETLHFTQRGLEEVGTTRVVCVSNNPPGLSKCCEDAQAAG